MKHNPDWAFYRRVFSVALPIIIQNGITNFVSMLDNIMVGQIGTLQMSGVSIVNQLIFVFNLCVFGAMSGAGIFTAQFYGAGDEQGVRHTFRFKLLIGLVLTAIGALVFQNAGDSLIGLYLAGESDGAAAIQTLEYGRAYLKVMLIGLLPFALSNAYASTLREIGQTSVPMVAGVCAVLVNLCLNYVLIYGHFGAPELGVVGAAIATTISKFVELAIVATWTHRNHQKVPFITGAYRSMAIPKPLLRQIIIKGMPLMINEALWSTGMAMMNQCYSVRGLNVVAAMNIASTISMLCSVVYMALGNSVGILMGQMLGSGIEEEQLRRDNNRMIRLSVASCLILAIVLIGLAFVFPMAYNTTDQVRSIATSIIIIAALIMPVNSYNNAMYFTLRSGGQTMVTFLFDSGFTWVVSVPVAFCLSHFTTLPIVPMYAICVGVDFFKSIVGRWMLNKGLWIRRIVVPASEA